MLQADGWAENKGQEMDLSWTDTGASIIAAFLASFVEFVEALTVVLAVGSVRGWKSAIAGSAIGCAALCALVLVLGTALARIPLQTIQLAVGTLILLFGLRWLRKAILRSAGIIPLHNEDAAFSKNTKMLKTAGRNKGDWDRVAIMTAFNITMLEGTEVIFIVIAIGAGRPQLLLASSLTAVAALAVVVALGLVLHKPLSKVPENMLKFIVGVLLSAFGTFWVGEGMTFGWPGGDMSIIALFLGYLLLAGAMVAACRAIVGNSAKSFEELR
jgi:uncharacterized membrane protein